MRVENTFYSWDMHDLCAFRTVERVSRALAVVPEAFDHEVFRSRLRREASNASRDEVYVPPVADRMLSRERKRFARTQLPSLQAEEGAFHLGYRPGYVVWLDPERNVELTRAVADIFHCECRCVADIFYPVDGFSEWHTHKYSKTDSWCMFLVNVDRSRCSSFRFIHPDSGDLLTCWDGGCAVNFFRLTPERLFWHCVGVEGTARWSQGFLVPENWIDFIH